MTSQFLAAAASVALIGAGFTGVGTRSIEAMPGLQSAFADGNGDGGGKACRVDVIRSGNPGVADIARQELDGGQCVCIVTTGPASSNGSAEDVVTNLLRDKTCDDAPLVGKEAAEAAAGGGGPGGILTALGVGSATGLTAGLAGGSNG